MFDKFGEFDSVEGLNKAAEGFKNEGDEQSLIELAIENGLSKEDAEDYIDDITDCLATLPMAAQGRLDVEEADSNIKNPMEKMALGVILLMLRGMCEDEDMQNAVLRKGKRAMDIFKGMKNEASKHKEGNIGVSCGTDRQLRMLIKAYYTESKEEFEKKLSELYK